MSPQPFVGVLGSETLSKNYGDKAWRTMERPLNNGKNHQKPLEPVFFPKPPALAAVPGGIPGVPVADVREGLHQGLEANLAHFCAFGCIGFVCCLVPSQRNKGFPMCGCQVIIC